MHFDLFLNHNNLLVTRVCCKFDTKHFKIRIHLNPLWKSREYDLHPNFYINLSSLQCNKCKFNCSAIFWSCAFDWVLLSRLYIAKCNFYRAPNSKLENISKEGIFHVLTEAIFLYFLFSFIQTLHPS